MAVSATHLTTAGDTTNTDVYNTGSITVSANTLVTVHVQVHKSGGPVDPVISGLGITWTQVSTNPGVRESFMFVGVSAAGATGSITFTCPGDTWTQCIWTVNEWPGADIGNGGVDGIVQSLAGGQSSTDPGMSLSTAPDTANATYAYGQSNAQETLAIDSPFTELGQANLSAPTTSIISGWVTPAEQTVNFTKASSVLMSMTLAEIRVAGTSGQTIVIPILVTTTTIFDAVVEETVVTDVIELPLLVTSTTVFSPEVTTLTTISVPVINAAANVRQPMTVTFNEIQGDLVETVSTVFNPALGTDIVVPTIVAPSNVNNPEIPANEKILVAPLLATESEIFAPLTTTFNEIVCEVLEVPATIHSPGLKYTIEVQKITTVTTIHEPSLEYLIQMAFINTAPTVHAPSIGDPPEIVEATGAIVKTHNPSPFATGI